MMKTIAELKKTVCFAQADAFFIDYLKTLSAAGVINIRDDDFEGDSVSDCLYCQVACAFGVDLDENLNPVEVAYE
ncbi:hypothetical protein RJ492_001214 [Pluralibacter gergoviae]|uniref:Uncharacterized protein n=1 Tax=Pluralibacter gergoviae TaxID=61647 RepID=A0AAI9DLD3_PLUGE|nr:hypothetical protein [Pluralibacter gergoviae]EKV9907703.1 hypothetical protein [Pluralibacter gergoviae]EKW7276828.1 hypothetical protein [Pluralibacter gergoviae]ELD4293965.1 hypothetical protein [Pluralibacter gergoviae]ELD4304744.1 hypothetical protein [Pluralibacter gergoviae]